MKSGIHPEYGEIPGVAFPNGGFLPVGTETDFFGPGPLVCTDALEALEPNTATAVSCVCPLLGNLPVNGGVDPFDTADFTCDIPPVPTLPPWAFVAYAAALLAALYGFVRHQRRALAPRG